MNVGDHVYIGAPAHNKVHWEIVDAEYDGRFFWLQSPMSGRRRMVKRESVTLHPASQREDA